MQPPPLPSNPYGLPTFPYAPPLAQTLVAPAQTLAGSPEHIRETHLSQENNLKALGGIFIFWGALLLLAAGSSLVALLGELGKASSVERFPMLGICLGLGILQLWTGMGLRKFKRQATIPATVLAILQLPAFPVGTIVGVAALACLHSEKGRFVMSDAYQAIVAQTPFVKAKSSKVVVILLVAVLAVLVLILSFFGYMMYQNANR